MKAIFLDFYGTIVHEDDDILPVIYEQVQSTARVECTADEIGDYWWKAFSEMFYASHGSQFTTQRVLNVQSLAETIRHFQSDAVAALLNQEQLAHWRNPGIFEDSIPFLQSVEIPVYILSNIDTDDVRAAMKKHGIKAAGVVTSEDVRSYKPRTEMFNEALAKYDLSRNDVIHIGDSLTSDVQGAQNAGIQAVWLNRKGKSKPGHIHPEYVCRDLIEVLNIL
ncbi:HAD family hydrolase [Paenibacillus xylanilyticus]|uniref:HAD family hydrolase n=1 Tax=Paenibacillus xylanilyticus TaxID=248903 RepID=A0A7Y6C4U2_9BACL|nr:HAD family hydrolase [Paenibacillus xylanilyticus]NUU79835.1 HAD family hydrolase [Paenibacillus xylanilyticus]